MVCELGVTVAPLIEKRGNVLRVRADDDLGEIRGDVTRLRQCLLNLLSNAAKFTERGQVTLTVRRPGGRDGPEVWFEVADTGVGMSAEELGRIFRPFTQGTARPRASRAAPGWA